ncbi:MAG: RHS repeat-associated core domain-containing protein [Verrucomicrobiota bacterium]
MAIVDQSGSTFSPAYDSNGNVMGYYATDTEGVVAEYEYGPFGELIRTTGSKVDDFSFLFSTKYEDAETGLLYYGYRYYDVETGRWLSRDPIEEEGGLNLYRFVGNNGVNQTDYLGLSIVDWINGIVESLGTPCCDKEEQALIDAERDRSIAELNFATDALTDAQRNGPRTLDQKFELAESRANAVVAEDRYYRALSDYANCMEQDSLYCAKGSAIIGATLDATSLGLAVSGGGAPAVAITYSLSVVNSAVTVWACGANRGNVTSLVLSASPIPGVVKEPYNSTITSVSLAWNTF